MGVNEQPFTVGIPSLFNHNQRSRFLNEFKKIVERKLRPQFNLSTLFAWINSSLFLVVRSNFHCVSKKAYMRLVGTKVKRKFMNIGFFFFTPA